MSCSMKAVIAGFTLAATVFSPVRAQAEGEWSASFVPKVGAVASVTGNVTGGDRFRIKVAGQACDAAQVFFTASSYNNVEHLQALNGKEIELSLNGAPVVARVSGVDPLLSFHVAFIDVETGPAEKIAAKYAANPQISINLVDKDGSIQKAFDVLGNSWNTNGLVKAVKTAQKLCRDNPTPQKASAPPCAEVVDLTVWASALKSGRQDDYLTRLKQCLPGDRTLQEQADELFLTVMGAVERVSTALSIEPARTATFIKKSLLVAAEAGYPSSQHNYATMHNMDARAPGAAYFPVDQDVFMQWTRRAAAQKEPRALFNLASRLLPSPQSPLPADPQTAYILLQQIAVEVPNEELRNQVFGPYLDQQVRAAIAAMGPDKVPVADAARAGFNFASLAP